MHKFSIVAMGPGHLDYTAPAALKVLEFSDAIVGASRLIETLQPYFEGEPKNTGKTYLKIDGRLTELKAYLDDHRSNQKIAVVVTGDSGFYSLLGYLSKNFSKEDFDVIPGISSLQYLFSVIKEQWAGAPLMSLHGRDCPYLEAVRSHRLVGLLTDKVNTPSVIARHLLEEGLGHVSLHVGSNLSYEDELIWSGPVTNLPENSFTDLCVVILENNHLEEVPSYDKK